MFFELRQYRILPGKRAEWVKFMEERIMPGQMAHGVVVVASFIGQQDEDAYVWIRRFDSEEHREQFNRDYYGSDEWQNELLPRVKEMLDFDSMRITRLEPTPRSVLR
jgi:NIPSNAP